MALSNENGSNGMVMPVVTLPATEMIITPAAVEEYGNVSRASGVPIWSNCCETIAVRNTSTQPILVQNANMVITK